MQFAEQLQHEMQLQLHALRLLLPSQQLRTQVLLVHSALQILKDQSKISNTHPLAARTRRKSSISLAWRLSTAASLSTSLTIALFTTRFARQAKRRVLDDSSAWIAAGVIAQIMAVLAFPPRLGCRMRVSLESR